MSRNRVKKAPIKRTINYKKNRQFNKNVNNEKENYLTGPPSDVWRKRWKGFDNGFCFCCKTKPITAWDFEKGHIWAKSKGGPGTLSNLVPICRECNKFMRDTNMYEYMLHNGYDKREYPMNNYINHQKENFDNLNTHDHHQKVRLYDFLSNMTQNQLLQIITMTHTLLPSIIEKSNLISTIILANITYQNIKENIHPNRRFLIKCTRHECCSTHFYDYDDESIEIDQYEFNIPGKRFHEGERECDLCKCNTYQVATKNEFYGYYF